MSYIINPNAKNRWARNAENTMDLSLETDASSVYLDNSRTLEQEIGEGSMVSNVTTVDSGMEKVIDDTLDGAYESCQMYGKSLVNLMTNCKDEYVVRYHDPSNPNHTVANISMMKPNTEYTLFYKAKYRTEGEGSGISGSLKIATSIEQGFIGTSQNLTSEYAQYVYKITTSSVVDCFVFSSTDKYFAIKECVLIEGNHANQDVYFFEGLCDAKMPILKNVGKNLFNPINIFYGIGKLNNDGSIFIERWSAGGNGWGETKMNCTSIPSGTYYVNILQNGEFVQNRNAVWVCNSSGKLIANVPNRTLFTINEPATRIDLVIQDTNNQTITNTVYTVHIEKVSELPQKDSSYEAYKTNILTTPEQVVLRKVGDICDSYDALTGEYVQRVGEVVLDGSEEINLVNSVSNSTHLYFDFVKGFTGAKRSSLAVCDRFTYVRGLYGDYQNVEGITIGNAEWGSIRILASKLTTPDVNGFKQWLRENPTTVQYLSLIHI